MKKRTVFVIFTATKLENRDDYRTKKRYCFNTESDVSEGDMLSSKAYQTPLQVVTVLDKDYKYYNETTGDLSNEITSTAQREIKDLVIQDKQKDDAVYASKISFL